MEAEEKIRCLDDMEYELERDKPHSENSSRLLSQLADSFISEEQLNNKGKLIGSFKTDKRRLLCRIIFAFGMTLGTLMLIRFSVYFILLFGLMLILMTIWILWCLRKFRMFIDIYENAVIGKVEFSHERKLVDLVGGTAYYKRAVELQGDIYITLYDDKVCRLRYMRDTKWIVYLLNRQKGIEKNGKVG